MIMMANENRLRMMIKKLGVALGNYFQLNENLNANEKQIRMYERALKNDKRIVFLNANDVQLRNFSQMIECSGCVRRAKRKGCKCK